MRMPSEHGLIAKYFTACVLIFCLYTGAVAQKPQVVDRWQSGNGVAWIDHGVLQESMDADDSNLSHTLDADLQLAQSGVAQDQGHVPGWDWVYSQPGENYTIQLFATKDFDKTGKFIQQYALSENARVIQAVIKGTTYYKVLTGSFSEWNDAAVEIGAFPQDLRNQRPWVRKFSSFYKELPEQAATAATEKRESAVVPALEAAGVNTQAAAVDQSSVENAIDTQTIPDQVSQSAGADENPETVPAAPNTPVVDDSVAIAANSGISDQNNEPKIETSSSQPDTAQVETEQQLLIARVELPETDEYFTNYTKKLLVSEEISAEQKLQLTAGLRAIAAGDHDAGYRQLSGLAEAGMPEAQYRIALMYSQGNGVQKDSLNAFKLMKSASEQGHPYAQQALADYYTKGVGVETNSALAAYWQQTAIDNINKLENQ